MKTRDMVLCAVFAAVIAVFAVMTVPIGQVPITLGLFGVMLTAVVLGAKRGAICVLVYILIGAVGLPVFSGFKGGFSVIAGATGGYISSYIFVALIIGAASGAVKGKNNIVRVIVCFAGCIAATIVCYFLGTLQFMAVTKNDLAKSLGLCVIPFIPFDILKGIAASAIGVVVSERVGKAK